MFEFIEGEIVEKSPTHLVVKAGSLAYFINISVYTYTHIAGNPVQRIYLHHVVREDAQLLYGFSTPGERELFRLLISVSGVGANTARLILSSQTPDEITHHILSGNAAALQAIKGIGTKSAQRIIVDLRDKVGKGAEIEQLFTSEGNTEREEALSALVALGFPRKVVEKSLNKIISPENELSVEEIVKAALKLM
ncbi:MAG: Holliday junction branch migration protein RuvA [Bacteroidales bacterium]|nr:Holliday junction branch migration protein RuvA [Bacteroidales bacterium]